VDKKEGEGGGGGGGGGADKCVDRNEGCSERKRQRYIPNSLK